MLSAWCVPFQSGLNVFLVLYTSRKNDVIIHQFHKRFIIQILKKYILFWLEKLWPNEIIILLALHMQICYLIESLEFYIRAKKRVLQD